MGRNTLNLYLLKQTENNDYDTYDSMVVCAENEEKARRISPEDYVIWSEELQEFGHFWGSDNKWYSEKRLGYWASHIDNVEVIHLGQAEPTLTEGVICSSFNAG